MFLIFQQHLPCSYGYAPILSLSAIIKILNGAKPPSSSFWLLVPSSGVLLVFCFAGGAPGEVAVAGFHHAWWTAALQRQSFLWGIHYNEDT